MSNSKILMYENTNPIHIYNTPRQIVLWRIIKMVREKGNPHIPPPFLSSSKNFSFRAMATTLEIISKCFFSRVGKLAKGPLLLWMHKTLLSKIEVVLFQIHRWWRSCRLHNQALNRDRQPIKLLIKNTNCKSRKQVNNNVKRGSWIHKPNNWKLVRRVCKHT